MVMLYFRKYTTVKLYKRLKMKWLILLTLLILKMNKLKILKQRKIIELNIFLILLGKLNHFLKKMLMIKMENLSFLNHKLSIKLVMLCMICTLYLKVSHIQKYSKLQLEILCYFKSHFWHNQCIFSKIQKLVRKYHLMWTAHSLLVNH